MDYTHNTYISDKYGLVKIILDISFKNLWSAWKPNQTKFYFNGGLVQTIDKYIICMFKTQTGGWWGQKSICGIFH